MGLSHREDLSIAFLIAYIPSFILAAIIAFRHGFGKNLGWIYLVIFSTVRIVGAAAELTNSHNPSTVAIICDSVGLSPLILTCVGLLSRANASKDSASKHLVPALPFRLTTLLSTVGLILCVIGGTSSKSSPKVDGKTKIGVLLFAAAWLGLGLLLMWLTFHISHVAERRLVFAVAVSTPLILSRLGYSALGAFLHNNHRFNPIDGSIFIQITMASIEEFVVVYTCLIVGLTLSSKPQEDTAKGYRKGRQILRAEEGNW